MEFVFHKRRGFSWVVERLSSSPRRTVLLGVRYKGEVISGVFFTLFWPQRRSALLIGWNRGLVCLSYGIRPFTSLLIYGKYLFGGGAQPRVNVTKCSTEIKITVIFYRKHNSEFILCVLYGCESLLLWGKNIQVFENIWTWEAWRVQSGYYITKNFVICTRHLVLVA